MQFTSLFVCLPLLVSVTAMEPWPVMRWGPYGETKGTEYNPDGQIPQKSTIQSITCRWDHRLDYLKVVYAVPGKASPTILQYGDVSQGKQEKTVNLSRDHISSVVPYICSDGKAQGLVCGLGLGFAYQAGILCGHDTSQRHAIIPDKNEFKNANKKMGITQRKINTFFTVQRPDKAIAQIGWTLKAE